VKKIQILLSTYNGEAHLREQLDSYLALNGFESVKVLIRDDGSTDGTLDILHEYVDKHGFELIEGENVGLNASMHQLVQACDLECDYFSFSDQDDVWLPDKLERASDALDKEDGSIPLLYSACSTITDDSLAPKGHTLIAKRPLSFYNSMIQNACIGHTQVCNRELIKLLRMHFSDDIYVHDSWVYTVATAFGKAIFDPTCVALYRQHTNNVIGYETSKLKNFMKRLKRLRTGKSRRYSYQLRAFCDLYGDMIPDEYMRECKKYFEKQRNFFTRLGYIMTTKMYRQTRLEGVIFRLMYLFGKYNLKNKSESKNKELT
jgi:glycosyltransferase involved in cell wall biosynthesis